MNSEELALMNQFGVTAEQKTIYHFEGRRYERLSDAINYAKARQAPARQPKLHHEN